MGKKRVYRKGTRYERRRKSGRGKRGGGRRRCVWVQRRGCRVTNEILVPFCLQYCRGCIREKEKGVGQKVGQFHRAPALPVSDRGTPCGGRGEGSKEVSERKTEKGGGRGGGGGGVYQAYNRGSPLKNYLFLAGWTGAPPRRSPRLD